MENLTQNLENCENLGEVTKLHGGRINKIGLYGGALSPHYGKPRMVPKSHTYLSKPSTKTSNFGLIVYILLLPPVLKG